MLLLIDNYDSFTFNLLHALQELGEEVDVVRNDALGAGGVEERAPEMLLVSPGPGDPSGAGASVDAIRSSIARRPVLGVCLGHQALGVALGARIAPAKRLVHGKAEAVRHDGAGMFAGLESPMRVARYHSLVLEERSLPAELRVSARAEDGDVMAVQHARLPVAGVQFHPESFLTPKGSEILAGFLRWARTPR